MAPLLASIVGTAAPIAVTAIVFVAYSLGYVIRYNIRHIESSKTSKRVRKLYREPEYLANVVLVLAYVIAVAFYLSLLSDFLLNYLGIDNLYLERLLTTVIIMVIAVVGYFRGLAGLERLESISMTIQLSVVVSLLVALTVFTLDYEAVIEFVRTEHSTVTQIQMLAGVLLIVQGFETSRFLGDTYSKSIRVRSMRIAQLISGALYIATVILLMPALSGSDLRQIELSAIIAVMAPVAVVLPALLMLAALMSQFSAAVADTSGGGGLLQENSRGRLSVKLGYVAVCAAAVSLIWLVDLLHIVALASRAFAGYYLIQTVLALIHNTQKGIFQSWQSVVRQVGLLVLVVILVVVVIFSIPAE